MLYSALRLATLLASAPLSASFAVARPAAASVLVVASSPPRLTPVLLSEQLLAGESQQADDCGCADTDVAAGIVVPTGAPASVVMNGVAVTGASLRNTELADVTGARTSIGSVIGEEGKAVIVFLRHLGWPLCWDYALNWQQQSQRLAAAGVAGPLYISVGQPAQLQQFLDLNPELAGATALIDDSADFAGYKAAGFNLLLGDKTLEKPPDFKPPKTMGPRKWWSYLANVGQLAPVPKDIKFGEVPQGVRVLGGTYAIDGDAVTFSHNDEVPGATPEIEEVLAAVGA